MDLRTVASGLVYMTVLLVCLYLGYILDPIDLMGTGLCIKITVLGFIRNSLLWNCDLCDAITAVVYI